MEFSNTRQRQYDSSLLYNQQIINFSPLFKGFLVGIKADIYSYSVKKEEFEFVRSETCDLNPQKCQLRNQLQSSVIKDSKLGFSVPMVALHVNHKKNNVIFTVVLDTTRDFGSQLHFYEQILLPSDVTVKFNLFIYDGPTFVCHDSDQLKVLQFSNSVCKIPNDFPETLSVFRIKNETLYFISAKKGCLTEYCRKRTSLREYSLINEEFLKKYLKQVNCVEMNLSYEKASKTVAYLICDKELFKFQEGRLKNSVLIKSLKGKVNKLFIYKSLVNNFEVLVIFSDAGEVFTVNEATFKILKLWNNVEKIGVDDLLFTGNLFLWVKFTSDLPEFSISLNRDVIITDCVRDIYPKETKEKEDGRIETNAMGSTALATKLKVGELMFEEASSRFKDKEEFINETISRMQEMSCSGIVNSPSAYPKLIDIVSCSNDEPEALLKSSAVPLKVLKLTHTIRKDFWLILLKIQNQTENTFSDFSLNLFNYENPVMFTVKFYNEENEDEVDLALKNIIEFKHYFTSISPILKPQKSVTVLAIMNLNQPLFQKLIITVEVAVLFTELIETENIYSKLRQQLCGPLSCSFEALNINLEKNFDVWSLALTERNITLQVTSMDSNLLRLQELLLDNLHLELDKSNFFLYVKNYNHPLTNIGLQVSSKICEKEAKIRVYYSSDTEIILLLHLLYANLPPDLIFTPLVANLQVLVNYLKKSLQTELETIREMISNQSRSTIEEIPMEIDDESPEESLQKIRHAFAARRKLLTESKAGEVDLKVYQNLHEKLSKLEEESDEYISLTSDINIHYH